VAKVRKPFLMRASAGVMTAVERLAAAELRSVNAQLEILLRESLTRRGVVIPPPGETDEQA
jgi:hypothetical protein